MTVEEKDAIINACERAREIGALVEVIADAGGTPERPALRGVERLAGYLVDDLVALTA